MVKEMPGTPFNEAMCFHKTERTDDENGDLEIAAPWITSEG
jgi:hypothetical protein